MKKSFHLLLFLVILPLTSLFCREVKIIIKDADLDIPLEGALVRLWDDTEYYCDINGAVVVQAPDDRQVTVRASYPGYESGALAIQAGGGSFTLGLRLSGILEGRELVIEAQRTDAAEGRSGRSVAISGEILERSSQIGLVEDVMTSIKLLPGVGYTGMFSALPSIRGGFPGDMMAVLDGFYIENPYHWGGGFSIFDPQMVESAKLSHGIFSTRFGHTVSGLLEISSKKADPVSAAIDLGISTSALNLNLSVPLGNKGGFIAMGKLTYWDPFVWFAKQLSRAIDWEQLEMVNAVVKAPYIRSSEITANYRFNSAVEWTAAAFIGTDGVGVNYLNEVSRPWIDYSNHMKFSWNNLQSFFITGLDVFPRPNMMFRATAGAGISQSKADAKIEYDGLEVFEITAGGSRGPSRYKINGDYLGTVLNMKQTVFNVQAKADFDWNPGAGFVLAAGVQELFDQHMVDLEGKFVFERRIDLPKYLYDPLYNSPFYYIQFPVTQAVSDVNNRRFNSSAYILGEYTGPKNKFSAELGLRMDHHYLRGKDFSIQTYPVLNPRLNLDYNILKNTGFVESFDITAGTGLFSSMNEAIASITVANSIDDFEIKPNRSWNSVAGIKMDFAGGWSFNLEGYFKYVYDRAYQYTIIEPGNISKIIYRFNGDGIVWGFDLMLQKFENRWWDGWITYTFTHAKYHQPEQNSGVLDSSGAAIVKDSGWYYPWFHRFHNINLVLNFKPFRNFSIYTRLGLASGRPKSKTGNIDAYPVELYNEDFTPVVDSIGNPMVISKYKRQSYYDENERTTWSIPWDLKLSYMFAKPGKKVITEIYLAAENLMSIFYVAKANTSFNQYTGLEDTGSDSANYEMPIPMVSFGIKWSF